MAENSKIEWCDHTFNPWWGCTKIAPECANCYAAAVANRYQFKVWGQGAPRRDLSEQNWKLPERWNRAAQAEGVRKRVFCASMADVFEGRRDRDEARNRLWDLIYLCGDLDWLLLTKRPGNIVKMVPHWWLHTPMPNVIYGTSVGCRKSLPLIDELREVPATMRFLSMEPLLEDVGTLDLTGISWVIVGGESGPGARPMHPDWARSIRDQCQSAGVPFFFKQWGEWQNGSGFNPANDRVLCNDGMLLGMDLAEADYEVRSNWRNLQPTVVSRVGKKEAGRLLDGREWNEFPEMGR